MKFKVLVPVLTLLALASADGAVVLIIDISNPAAVVITSVANNSLITGNLAVNFNGGISLTNFFTQNESITVADPLAISGNWTSRGTLSAFNEVVTFAYGDPDVVPGVDLSIYNVDAPGGDDQNLLNSAAPFTGIAVVNMSAFTFMPTVGATGNVNLGYQPSQGGAIGEYSVVPEPSVALLAAAGMVGVVGMLRRRV